MRTYASSNQTHKTMSPVNSWFRAYAHLSFCLLCLMIQKTNSVPTYLYSFCSNQTTFATKSKYHTNLNTVFSSLTSNATTNPNGFYATAFGSGTSDVVYGLFLCRGDLNVTTCSDCVSTATTKGLPSTYCPMSKVATIWYDECMVRYSNVSLYGKMVDSPKVFLTNTQNITGNQTLFTDILGHTMNDLAVQTANSKSGEKFATKVSSFTSLEQLYALEQCTPDLSASDCNQCLSIAIGQIAVRQGARVLQPSCNVRYEIYPFFNGAANSSSPSTPPPFSGTNTTGVVGTPAVGGHGKKKVSTKIIMAIVAPQLVAVLLVMLALGIYCAKKRAKKYDAVAVENGDDFKNADSLKYDLATLQSATNDFSGENKLGEGGFGCVYKGTLPDKKEIAVKRLSKGSGQGGQEFKNEVLLVAKLQHRNLVRLLGFCLEGEEKLLVYEYVPNKSLDYFLFDPEKQGQLDWGRRYNIIGGVARGMLYLHQDSRLRIIHRDLKASNILLDVGMNAKISDFGMAKIFGVDQTQGNTSRVVGTYGYMSPEYAMHGQFSVKSDVYSFGVLVLEIISGKRNSTFYESGYAEDLLSYAWRQWRDGSPLEFVDSTIRDSCSVHEVMRCIHLGLLCVQESMDVRPTIATAVMMLDSHTITLPVPEQPAFFIKSREKTISSKNGDSDHSTNKSVPWSVNDVSVTEIEAR